jgi:hypothetical protein
MIVRPAGIKPALPVAHNRRQAGSEPASPLPDFFIAGAAKCGTTALARYLGAHRSAFIPAIKEANFFCTDLEAKGGVRSLAEYHSLFAAVAQPRLCGDASALYLYSRVAIGGIMEHNPRARIVVMLRYPVDAAHSLHAARWSRGHENVEEFEDAWRLQSARLRGSHVPPNWPDPQTLQYGRMYLYAEQIRRVVDLVPETQRLVLIYEEFFADPHAHYPRVLKFLGLDVDQACAFPVVNSSVAPRFRALDGLLRRPPAWLTMVYRPVRPLIRAMGLSPLGVVRSLNLVSRPKSPLRPAFRAELQAFFEEDLDELERLLGRPLWRALRRPCRAVG